MDVLFYIKELLESQKTISIDGIGTLYKKKSPGKYDLEKHVFVPPNYSIGFNEKVNDVNELGTFIANATNTTIENANQQINQFVEKIHHSLKNAQDAELEGLGNFKVVDHHLTFNSVEKNVFWNEYYGLPKLNELSIIDIKIDGSSTIEESKLHIDLKEDSVKSTIVTVEDENNLFSTNLESNETEKDNSLLNNYEDGDIESEGKTSSTSKLLVKLFLTLAVFAVIIGTTYFFKPTLFDSILNNNTLNRENSKADIPLDITTYNNDTLTKDSIPDLDSTVVLVPLSKPIDSNITTYEVIGSAERTQKRVDLVISTFKKRGIDAKALDNIPGKLIKISLGSFTDFNLAKKQQDSLRKKLNNPEIYIHTIKPKN